MSTMMRRSHVIVEWLISHGPGVQIGSAASHLFEAAELAAFSVAWMEKRFGERVTPTP